MKPRESTIQAKEFKAAALRRQLAQFERMIADLDIIRTELGKQIEALFQEALRRKDHEDPETSDTVEFDVSGKVPFFPREVRSTAAQEVARQHTRGVMIIESMDEKERQQKYRLYQDSMRIMRERNLGPSSPKEELIAAEIDVEKAG